MTVLEETQHFVAGRMDEIMRMFKSGSKITVLVRTPGYPDRDFVMSNDALPEVAKMIARRGHGGEP